MASASTGPTDAASSAAHAAAHVASLWEKATVPFSQEGTQQAPPQGWFKTWNQPQPQHDPSLQAPAGDNPEHANMHGPWLPHQAGYALQALVVSRGRSGHASLTCEFSGNSYVCGRLAG